VKYSHIYKNDSHSYDNPVTLWNIKSQLLINKAGIASYKVAIEFWDKDTQGLKQ